jgi:hypothetical protein
MTQQSATPLPMYNIGGYTIIKPATISEQDFVHEMNLMVDAYEAQGGQTHVDEMDSYNSPNRV